MFLIGGDDFIVKATASGKQNTILPDLWPSTIDMQVALFETRDGRGIKICRSQVTPRPEPHTVYYSIYGTKGFIENNRHDHDGVGLRYFEGIDKVTVPINCYQNEVEAPDFAKNSHGTSDYYIAQDFLDCIEFNRKPILNEDRAMELTLPGLIAHEAAVTGGVVAYLEGIRGFIPASQLSLNFVENLEDIQMDISHQKESLSFK